jgi:hypothetical protein
MDPVGAEVTAAVRVANLLGRDAILAAPDLATQDVEVPEWGGTVRLRMMNGQERDAFEASCMVSKADGTQEFNMRNLRARLVAVTLVDAEGKRLFNEGDVDALGRKSAKALGRVFEVASKLNGITDDDASKLAGEANGQGEGSFVA